MTINTDYLMRCVDALEAACGQVPNHEMDSVMYDVYRAACVKQFELVLEQSGKLLRKRIRPYFASNQQVDRLHFKDCFRHAAKHGLLTDAACERWLRYRDHRNSTVHDYGQKFAEETLVLLPIFVADAKELSATIAEYTDG
ncbi:MAG: nucleotidyltransferase substrate binding protein [Acidimicrobiaceae bacterium]|nr:nucleotidyltransferase substrate binding protein [Acidimicrobiaceae bacterium]MDE0607556.1 nucleotidyltransferase substrate binding protein [Acidimicrobiaceae bacterium]